MASGGRWGWQGRCCVEGGEGGNVAARQRLGRGAAVDGCGEQEVQRGVGARVVVADSRWMWVWMWMWIGGGGSGVDGYAVVCRGQSKRVRAWWQRGRPVRAAPCQSSRETTVSAQEATGDAPSEAGGQRQRAKGCGPQWWR